MRRSSRSDIADRYNRGYILLFSKCCNKCYHFIAVQLGEPGRVGDEQLLKLLGAMNAFPAPTDAEVADKKWYLENVWAPTLFRYNGDSVWEMWAAREGLKVSMTKLLTMFDSPLLDTDIYNPGHPPDILMLYMLYGNQDVRSPSQNMVQTLIKYVAKKFGIYPWRKTCWCCA